MRSVAILFLILGLIATLAEAGLRRASAQPDSLVVAETDAYGAPTPRP